MHFLSVKINMGSSRSSYMAEVKPFTIKELQKTPHNRLANIIRFGKDLSSNAGGCGDDHESGGGGGGGDDDASGEMRALAFCTSYAKHCAAAPTSAPAADVHCTPPSKKSKQAVGKFTLAFDLIDGEGEEEEDEDVPAMLL